MMILQTLLLLIAIALLGVNIYLSKSRQTEFDPETAFDVIQKGFQQFEKHHDKTNKDIKDDFQRNREESSQLARQGREELAQTLQQFKTAFDGNTKTLNDLIRQEFKDFNAHQLERNTLLEQRFQDIKTTIGQHLEAIRTDNSKQLEAVRQTVDEKLQKTLNQRLTQSFETVGNQLKAVQEGLGEMKTLATDVGGLKKVLSNVKMRGNIGEVQLEMLLEQILAPDQYEANVKTNKDTNAIVEFAVKLPGRNTNQSNIWLPIDAKFPKEIYEKLQEAYDIGDPDFVASAQKELEQTIKKMAKDISSKYLNPPHTTDFAILFLPFEGIYAEVVRKAALLETLQREYKVIVTGPTTLAAILNSLQMGFRTLAIQKRTGEVWSVLGAVKKEFENFGGLMQKAQKNIQTGLNQLDDVMGVRTRAIERKLRDVQTIEQDQIDHHDPKFINGIDSL